MCLSLEMLEWQPHQLYCCLIKLVGLIAVGLLCLPSRLVAFVFTHSHFFLCESTGPYLGWSCKTVSFGHHTVVDCQKGLYANCMCHFFLLLHGQSQSCCLSSSQLGLFYLRLCLITVFFGPFCNTYQTFYNNSGIDLTTLDRFESMNDLSNMCTPMLLGSNVCM